MALGLNNYKEVFSVKFEHVWQDGKNLSKSKPLMQKIRNNFEAAGLM